MKFPHTPVVTATIQESGVLRLQLASSPAGSATDFDGVHVGDAIVQVRCSPAAGYDLQYQRITAPGTAAQWTAWTDIEVADLCKLCAVFYTGTYVVVAYWVDGGANWTLKWRRSSDGGVSWSAAQTIVVVAVASVYSPICGASGGAAQSGLFYWKPAAGTLAWLKYQPATDNWAAEVAGTACAYNVTGLAAAWDSDNNRHVLAYAYQNTTGGNNKLLLLTHTTADVWSTPISILALANKNNYCMYMSLSQAKINGYFWLTFDRYNASTSRGDFLMAAITGGLAASDVVTVEVYVSVTRVKVYSALASYYWVASVRNVRRSISMTTISGKTVVKYRWDWRRSIGRVEVTLDNRDGAITAGPPFFAWLTLVRGLSVAGVTYSQAAKFFVTGFRFAELDRMVTIYAVDALGLLDLWKASETYVWENQTLRTLITQVCGLARVLSVTFDGAGDWDGVTVDKFSLHNSQTGLTAVHALLSKAGDGRIVARDEGVLCFVPDLAADHTYNATHLLESRFGQDLAPNYILVVGVNAAAYGDADDGADVGYRVPEIVMDAGITTAADARDKASDMLIYYSDDPGGVRGEIVTPVNFALERLDNLTVSAGLWADGTWRVLGFAEEYHMREVQPFVQRLVVRAL